MRDRLLPAPRFSLHDDICRSMVDGRLETLPPNIELKFEIGYALEPFARDRRSCMMCP